MDQPKDQGDTATLDQPVTYDVEEVVRERYAAGAERCEQALCCPTSYDPQYLKVLPGEILERDYGCGDPSAYVDAGQTALDLGCGGGKACYILAQKVGAEGRVIGVDFNDDMLSLARRYENEIARKIGYRNVHFFKGRIQDLALDLGRAEIWLRDHPISNVQSWQQFEAECDRLRRQEPMIREGTIDVVVSNCVLNLVKPEDKRRLFAEIARVLRKGSRAVISDIVSDEDVTDTIRNDPKLWSGCIAGAFREDEFLKMFQDAGFYGIEILHRDTRPWQVIDGIEFRSVTVRAYKGKEGPCLERNQAVVYGGPWRQVKDDDGHTFVRGQRTAVCDKTFKIMTDPKGPYDGRLFGIEPYDPVPRDEAAPFDCKGSVIRHPRQTKGRDYELTTEAPEARCGPGDCC